MNANGITDLNFRQFLLHVLAGQSLHEIHNCVLLQIKNVHTARKCRCTFVPAAAEDHSFHRPMYFSTRTAENQAFFQENPLVFICSALYNNVCHIVCKGSECHGVQKTNRSLLYPPAGQLLGHDQLHLRLSSRDRPRPGLYDRTGRNLLRAVLSGKPVYTAGHRRLG